MDYQFESEWVSLTKTLQMKFEMDLDLQSILFLIGVQELGQGYSKFKKHEKMDLMHIAICTILEPYGYYMYAGKDKDGWPHYDVKERMPELKPAEQEHLMKNAVLDYFKSTEII